MKKLIISAFVLYSSLSFAQEVKPSVNLKPLLKSNIITKHNALKKKHNKKIMSKLDSIMSLMKNQQNKILVITGSMKDKNKK